MNAALVEPYTFVAGTFDLLHKGTYVEVARIDLEDVLRGTVQVSANAHYPSGVPNLPYYAEIRIVELRSGVRSVPIIAAVGDDAPGVWPFSTTSDPPGSATGSTNAINAGLSAWAKGPGSLVYTFEDVDDLVVEGRAIQGGIPDTGLAYFSGSFPTGESASLKVSVVVRGEKVVRR